MAKPFYIDDHLPRDSGGTTIAAFARNSYPAQVLPSGCPFFVVMSKGRNIRVVQSNGLSRDFEDLNAVLEEIKTAKTTRLIGFDPRAETRLKPILEKDANWVTNSHYKEGQLYWASWYKSGLIP